MSDDTSSASDDIRLLHLFKCSGDEGAFRVLVERYSGLVYHSALRVAGDAGQAEEATQDVFILLAKKTPDTGSFPSLAGWLYRAAVHVARHLQRQQVRRRLREQQAVMNAESGAPVEAAEWREILPVLDTALEQLPKADSEALVRRFLQGENLKEVGRALRTSEDAARMRINRALERLRSFLARRGITSTSAALAAALGSHARAMGTSPPGLTEKASLAALTSGPLTAQQLTIAATLMTVSKTPLLITAAVGLLCLTTGTFLGRTVLKPEQEAAPPPAGAAVRRPASGEPFPAAMTAELTRLQAELTEEKAKRADLEKSYAALKSETEPLKDQVVIAYGKVGEIGQNFGDLFTEARDLIEIEAGGELKTPEGMARLTAFMKKAASLGGLSQEIIGFEDNPAEGSRFQSAAYKSVFGLTDEEQARVAAYFEKTMAAAHEMKLTLSHLPAPGTPEFKPWLEKRWAFFNASRPELLEAIPEAKRSDFETWVEKGGYGFKNLKLGGGPLMFSLGGQPEEEPGKQGGTR